VVRTVPQRVKVSRHLRRRRESDIIERATLMKKARFPRWSGKEESKMRTRAGGNVPIIMTVEGGGGSDPTPVGGTAEISISRSAWKESMAHTIDQLLGFDIVPPTYLREMKPPLDEYDEARDDYGRPLKPVGVAVQRWVPGAVNIGSRRAARIEPNEEDLIKIFLFDIIVGNPDRHDENIVVETKFPYHAWGIDHELIMSDYVGASPRLVVDNYAKEALDVIEGKRIPEDVLQRIRDMQWEDFITATAGIGTRARNAAWRRRALVLKWKTIPTEEELMRM